LLQSTNTSTNSCGLFGETYFPHPPFSTKSFVQPEEFTTIGSPADKLSNNLLGELVRKIGMSRKDTKETSHKFTISDNMAIGCLSINSTLSKFNSLHSFSNLDLVPP